MLLSLVRIFNPSLSLLVLAGIVSAGLTISVVVTHALLPPVAVAMSGSVCAAAEDILID